LKHSVQFMLYLLRHGETIWNAEGRYQGQKDSPLTPRGCDQAASLGRILSGLSRFSRTPLQAYVSPLGRTQEAADIVGRHVSLDRVDEPRLMEVSMGSWDGMTHCEVTMEYPEALAGADRYDWYFHSPDGESLDAFVTRVSAWLKEAHAPAAVISHGVTGRILRGVYLGLSKREMLELPTPQDGLYELNAGGVRFITEADVLS
jgi:broad specificity phosphatase PhoE